MTNILSEHNSIDSLEISDDALAKINLILEDRRNFSLSVYKDKCMKRRIAIRMRACHCLDAAAYCRLLQQSDQELDLLKKNLTIHVSHFFRNPSMFDKLQQTVLPELFLNAGRANQPLRLLSLGCAGGEEAYSIGIILRHFFGRELLRTSVEINAYDIDADILQAARRGEYNEDRLKDILPELKERYFVANGALMQLSVDIREMVSFQLFNIMDIESIVPCHIVLCRNTLIYFNRADQGKILRGIANILPQGGILVLGKSETLTGPIRPLFTSECPAERIYRRL